MDIQHLNVKVFVENYQDVERTDFVTIFNNWIQRRVGEELLVDVADYRHVFAGPGVILIGHEANYSLDSTGNRLGLLYNRKAPVSGTAPERLAQAVRSALLACRRLETENHLKFSGREVQLLINDRLVAPNTEETFAALAPELRTLFDQLYGGEEYALDRNPDPRERFTVSARTAAAFDAATLLKNLEREKARA